MSKRELKVHYLYEGQELHGPENASFCTPKKTRRRVTRDPKEVTCGHCKFWSEADATDEAFFADLEARKANFWDRYFTVYRNETRERYIRNSIGAALSIMDGLVGVLSLGHLRSGFEIDYLFSNLRRDSEEELAKAQAAEKLAPPEQTQALH